MTTRRRAPRPRYVALLVAAVGLLATACSSGATSSTAALAAPSEATEGPWRGIGLTRPVAMPDLTLTDTSGATYDLRARTAGMPTLLFFGYTHCPDVCPVHMANIARALHVTGLEAGVDLEVVFVTVDPERDTPARLAAFLGNFDPRFVGLTGPLDEITDAITGLGLAPPVKEDPLPGGGYTVGHPAQVLAYDAGGRSQMVYPFGVRASAWAHDLPKIAEGAPWPTP